MRHEAVVTEQTAERDMATGQGSTHGCLNITKLMMIIHSVEGAPFVVCNRVNSDEKYQLVAAIMIYYHK